MANEEQLAILKQGARAWNEWRSKSDGVAIDLSGAELEKADLGEAHLGGVNLSHANLREAFLAEAFLTGADLSWAQLTDAVLNRAELTKANLRKAILADAYLDEANLTGADLREAYLMGASLCGAQLGETNLERANFSHANLTNSHIGNANFNGVILGGSDFSKAFVSGAFFRNSNLSRILGLETTRHFGPSNISTETFALSRGHISEAFLRGCGLSDWEIEQVKLYQPGLSNDEITQIQYKVYELRASQALQISRLFISYTHEDSPFVDKISKSLNKKGIRYWRDIHDMKAGRIEKQIDTAIRQNPTVLLILSKNSLSSDWVEHEARTARALEKDLDRDVLCPVALDDSWKDTRWPRRLVEQIMEYNILDFSAWKDDKKFDAMFRRLIDGLDLFYK